ncbi:MAG: lamin tail domain-containing protein, partial [Chloroflexi bacterium]|nr:lamin tail domain-containing protein [Chloroflexota bacterium]
WKLSAGPRQVYTFPPFILPAGSSVKVHTSRGTNTTSDLYWGRSAVWNNQGDTGVLYDATGREVTRYTY